MIVHSDTLSHGVFEAVPIRRLQRRQYAGSLPQSMAPRMVKEADALTQPGQLGALLRREGLYSSNLPLWRRQMQEGLVPKKRGPRAHKPDPRARRIEELEWDNEKLAHKLRQAELIIEVQKKVADLLKGSSGENS